MPSQLLKVSNILLKLMSNSFECDFWDSRKQDRILNSTCSKCFEKGNFHTLIYNDIFRPIFTLQFFLKSILGPTETKALYLSLAKKILHYSWKS